ncbi:MAG: hypothetical protein A4S09_17595 [Proteobacteria bacterium SG_bin7]|nr:MAG: hypothetical protein A4S09_17595 [Proteobacteria bacterium SG_bin7]
MRLNKEILEHIHTGRYQKAQDLIEKHLEEAADDREKTAIALFHLSWLQHGRGQQLTEIGVATVAQLASLAIDLNDNYVTALALFRRGAISFCKGRLGQAKVDWDNADLLFSKSIEADSYEVVWLKYHLALAIRDLHGYQFAIPKFQEIITLKSCSQDLRYKIIRELFFCYCYLNEYKSAYQCFENLESNSSHINQEIDFQIFRAHLAILKKNYRSARKLVLKAIVSARRLGFGRDRYDFNFHLAYLYAQKNNFKKMRNFISYTTDPIYKLQLFNIALENGDFSVLPEFETLAFDLGITQFIEKAHQHHKSRPGLGSLVVNAKNLTVTFKNRKLLGYGQKEVNFLILLGTSTAVSKIRVTREIFGDNFYEPTYHDPKIYRLVCAVNAAAPFALNRNGNYILNPATRMAVLNTDNEKIKIAAGKIAAAFK